MASQPLENSSSTKKIVKSIFCASGSILARATLDTRRIRLEIFTKVHAFLIPDGFRYCFKAILKYTWFEKTTVPANMQFPAAGNAYIPESNSYKG
jgi:hypothetical protein